MSTKLTQIVADFQTQLASKIAVADTTMTLQSATDDDGTALPSGEYCFTLDKNNASKEYLVGTLSGTAISALKTVTRQGVQSSGVALEHRTGATVEITDFVNLKYLTDLLNGTTTLDSTAPLGYDGTVTPTTANQIATKSYADGIAIAGGADSSDSVKGITKLSVSAVSPTDPIAVGDNDGRVPTTDEKAAIAGNSGTAVSASNKLIDADDVAVTATANKIVRANGSNKIDADYLNISDANVTDLTDGGTTTLHKHLMATGQTTRVAGSGTGTQNIAHGLGVIPSLVRITATAESTSSAAITMSHGTATSTSDESCTYIADNGAAGLGNIGQDSTHIIKTVLSTSATAWSATLSTLDATNITLTFDTATTPGDIYIQWEALA